MKATRLWGKKNETKILYLARVNVTEPKEVLNTGFTSHFSFPKTLLASILHHHYLLLQFLYSTNFLVRECLLCTTFGVALIITVMTFTLCDLEVRWDRVAMEASNHFGCALVVGLDNLYKCVSP